MFDTDIKRAVLRELMDKLDGMDRDSMRPSFDEHDDMQPEMGAHDLEDKPESTLDVKLHKEPDEDDMPSIDPIVMLAKKFHR